MATFSGRGGASLSRAQASGVAARPSHPAAERSQQRQVGGGSGGWEQQLQGGTDAFGGYDQRHQGRSEGPSRRAQLQLLSSARSELASEGARSPPTVEPSLTAGGTAEQLVSNELLPRPAAAAEGTPPQSGETVFSRLYQEKLEHEKKVAEEIERSKRKGIEDRWEKLESERAVRDIKHVRQLVEDMEVSISDMRRQLGNERAARLALELQVQEGQKSVTALQRQLDKQAANLRTSAQHENDNSSRQIVELNTRIVELSTELEEEREERARVADLLQDMGTSRRDLTARVKALEQRWAQRKSDAEIERQVHSMQDECLAQVESMSNMLDEMASVATRVDAAEEKISRATAEEQQRRVEWEAAEQQRRADWEADEGQQREDWEREQQEQRFQFEQSMRAISTNQHKIAVATLQRLDNEAQADAEEAEVRQAVRDSIIAASERVSASPAATAPPASTPPPGRRPQDRRVGEEARATRVSLRQRQPSPSPPQQQRHLPAAVRASSVNYTEHDRSSHGENSDVGNISASTYSEHQNYAAVHSRQAVGSDVGNRTASTYRDDQSLSPFDSTIAGGIVGDTSPLGRYSEYSDYDSEHSGYPSQMSQSGYPSTRSTRSHNMDGSSYDEEMFMMEEGAAITIQASYRGWVERERQAQMLQLEREQLQKELQQEGYQFLDRGQPAGGTPHREFPTPGPRVGSPGRQAMRFRVAEEAGVGGTDRLGHGSRRIGGPGRE